MFGYPILFQSRILAILRQWREIRSSVQTWPTRSEDRSCEFEGVAFTPEAYLELLRHKLFFMLETTIETGWFDAHIRHVEQTLREMKEYLAARNIGLRVVIIPDELQIDEALQAATARHLQVTSKDYDILRPQRILKTILNREQIPYLDLFDSFRQHGQEPGAEPLYIPRNTHWSLQGNRLAAERIVQWLTAGQAVPDVPAPVR
jgi:hypothetical protein